MTGASGPPPGVEPCCEPLLARPLGEDEAQELAVVLRALADPVRLRLVSVVAASPTGEVCACDLPDLLERSQPTTSHHLTQLVRAGVLERSQRGRWAWFRLRPERLDVLRAALAAPRTGAD
jgi:ArsR family transcriptional regulator, arsenate/arsenite/antimonite-responsive transcriptional repressor